MAPKWAPKVEAKPDAVEEVKKEGKGSGKGKGGGKEGGKDGGKDGKGRGKGGPKRSKELLSKESALKEIVALDPTDDARESTSKKISWILRKGASRINIDIDKDGWVKLSDILNSDILQDAIEKDEAKLMHVIEESNKQKLRYELKDGADGKLIKALKKEDRKPKSESSEPKKQIELSADAPIFTPGAAPIAAAATAAPGSPMAAYPGMGYPSFGFSPYGMYPFGYPGYGAYAAAATAVAANAAATAGRFTGRIKSFNQEKGYGFIESSESFQVHGRDVFLHKLHMGEFTVGTWVTFKVENNKQGMPQARDLAATTARGSPGQAASTQAAKRKDKKPKGEKKEKVDNGDKDKAVAEGDKAKADGDTEKAEDKKAEPEQVKATDAADTAAAKAPDADKS